MKTAPPSDPATHPAFTALRLLEPERPEPERIEALKGDYRKRNTRKSAVYRMGRGGRDGYGIIAKRCLPHIAESEQTIYTEILPQLPVPSLRFHGSVGDGEEFRWLFLEDGGEHGYSIDDPAHRRLAADWLALLHGCGARMNLTGRLPDRSAAHYLGRLHSSRETLLAQFNHPVLTDDDRRVFERMLACCEAIEERWERIADFCEGLPRTVVHGDFVPKNMRLRATATSPALLVFDWEYAGWGIPAADLAQKGTRSPAPDLEAYRLAARRFWPQLREEEMPMLDLVGRIFRLLCGIGWACDGLHCDETRWRLDPPLAQFRSYDESLREALEGIDRADVGTPPVMLRYPSDEALATGLASALRGQGIESGPVRVLERTPNDRESSFPSELVSCRFNGEEAPRQLLCKYGTGYIRYSYGHRGGVAYEAEVYEKLLVPLDVTIARFMGSYSDPASGATWLALEFLEGCSTASKKRISMTGAATWIGQFHAAAAARLEANALPFLNAYDADYYRGWIDRTARFAAHLHHDYPWLRGLCERREEIVGMFLAFPRTVIHGEFYNKNVLFHEGVVRPVDWESPAVAFGEIDLASLFEGKWPQDIVDECQQNYREARWPEAAPDDFPRRLDAAGLYLSFRWLGDHPQWTTHKKGLWRFDTMREAAERLGLL